MCLLGTWVFGRYTHVRPKLTDWTECWYWHASSRSHGTGNIGDWGQAVGHRGISGVSAAKHRLSCAKRSKPALAETISPVCAGDLPDHELSQVKAEMGKFGQEVSLRLTMHRLRESRSPKSEPTIDY